MRIPPAGPRRQGREFAENGRAGAAFKQWMTAVTAFKDARRRGADDAEVARLRREAIRWRSLLTVDESSTGGGLPDDLLRCLLPAELRLDEADQDRR